MLLHEYLEAVPQLVLWNITEEKIGTFLFNLIY